MRSIICLLFSAFCAQAAWVAHTPCGNTNTSGTSTTCNLTVSAGDLILCFAGSVSGNPITCSDSASNSYSVVVNVTDNRPATLYLWKAVAVSSGTITVTASIASGVDAELHAVNFGNTAGVITGAVNAVNSDPAISSVVLSGVTNGSLLVGFGDSSYGTAVGTVGPGTGTQIESTLASLRLLSEYNTATSAGSQTVAKVDTTQRGIIAAAFTAPSGSAAGYSPLRPIWIW